MALILPLQQNGANLLFKLEAMGSMNGSGGHGGGVVEEAGRHKSNQALSWHKGLGNGSD